MKKLLLLLFTSLTLLAPAVNAQWFGKYGSIFEAKQACSKWKKAGPDWKIPSNPIRACTHEKETRQIVGASIRIIKRGEGKNMRLSADTKVIKRFRY
jgi:hypothetical protein